MGLLCKAAIDVCYRRPRLLLPVWAERYREIAGGPLPGRWRNSTAPLGVGIMEACDDPAIRQITVVGPVQSSKSENAIINPMIRDIERGKEVLYINSTDEVAEDIIENKIMPAMRDSRELKWLIPGKWDHGTKGQRKYRSGAILHSGGAQSITGLVSWSVEACYLDEIAKYRLSAGEEAGVYQQAIRRASAFEATRKIHIASTPKTDKDLLWEQLMAGDYRRPWVQCPTCGEWWIMHWSTNDGVDPDNWENPLLEAGTGGIRWDGDDHMTAHYVCPRNGCIIPEQLRHGLIVGHQWRPGQPDVVGHASFWYWSAYSPFNSWSALVKRVLDQRKTGNEETRKDIVQMDLALPYHDPHVQRVKLHQHVLAGRLNGMDRGSLAPECMASVGFIDVAARLIHWARMAWLPERIGFIVDYGLVETELSASIDVRRAEGGELRAVELLVADGLMRAYEAMRGGELARIGIDAGWSPRVVRGVCAKLGMKAIPCLGRGDSEKNKFKMPVASADKHPGEVGMWYLAREADGTWTLIHNCDEWKKLVHEGLRLPLHSPGSMSVFGRDPGEHRELGRHMTSEVYEADPVTMKGVWVQHGPNHWFDCVVGCHVLGSVLGVRITKPEPTTGRGKPRGLRPYQPRTIGRMR